MPFHYQENPKKNYLLITMVGEYAYAELGAFFDWMLSACEKYKLPKVMIDARNLNGNPTTLERFNFAAMLTVKYFAMRMTAKVPPLRFAFVGNHPLVDAKRIGETVAVNRGMNIKVTTEWREALDWLGVEEEK